MSADPMDFEVPAPLPSPSRRLHDLTMAMATRPMAARTESTSLKQPATGTHVGQWLCDDLTVIRDDGETLADYMTRLRVSAIEVTRVTMALNSELVREEMARDAEQKQLQELRVPVTT